MFFTCSQSLVFGCGHIDLGIGLVISQRERSRDQEI